MMILDSGLLFWATLYTGVWWIEDSKFLTVWDQTRKKQRTFYVLFLKVAITMLWVDVIHSWYNGIK